MSHEGTYTAGAPKDIKISIQTLSEMFSNAKQTCRSQGKNAKKRIKLIYSVVYHTTVTTVKKKKHSFEHSFVT